MTDSHQALLFDKNRGTHVLADVGSVIGTYTVMAIDEDEVTLSSGGREVVLAAPETSPAPKPAKKGPVVDTKVLAPADPYSEPAIAAASEDGVRIAAAPSSEPMTNPYDEAALDAALIAGAGSVRAPAPGATVITGAGSARPAPAAVTITEMEVDPYGEPATEQESTQVVADPYAEPAPAAKPAPRAPVEDPAIRAFVEAMDGQVIVNTPDAPAASKPATPATPATIVSRQELTSALGDFAGLTASVRGAFTPAGARIDVVAPGTVFAKAGLRSGDVIASVDGQPLRSIDDAAELYIRAGSARTATVQLLRAGKPTTLRLAIQ